MNLENSVYFSIDFWYHVFRENTVRTADFEAASLRVRQCASQAVHSARKEAGIREGGVRRQEDARKPVSRQSEGG